MVCAVEVQVQDVAVEGVAEVVGWTVIPLFNRQGAIKKLLTRYKEAMKALLMLY